jgi:hypothetical protein
VLFCSYLFPETHLITTNWKKWELVDKTTYRIFIAATLSKGRENQPTNQQTNKQRERVGKTITISWMPDSPSFSLSVDKTCKRNFTLLALLRIPLQSHDVVGILQLISEVIWFRSTQEIKCAARKITHLALHACKKKNAQNASLWKEHIGILLALKIQLSMTTSNILRILGRMSLILSVIS